MTWNNKKIAEIKDRKNQEASELYKKYHEESKSESTVINDENEVNNLYSEYKDNKDFKTETPANSEENLNKLYSDYKENGELLKAYKIYIGDYEIPVTPDTINFKNDTETKTFKSIKGKDIIVGVTVLPREVSFASYFPYMIKDKISEKSPKEYKDYFQNLKNKGEKILLKIEGPGESFKAYITKFDYDYIPGRDIEYSITLKEYSEESENDFEI